MGVKTGIKWCDSTWNPIRGCSRVSEGCRHCYAETMAARFGGEGQAFAGLAVMQNGQPHWTGKIEFVEKHLLDPLKWGPVVEHGLDCLKGKGALHVPRGCLTRRRRIFVNSVSDLFHENVTDAMRDKIFAVMALCPQHIFQVLTKRPERMLEYLRMPERIYAISECLYLIDTDTKGDRLICTGMDRILKTSKYGVEYKYEFPLPNVWLGVSVENQKAADERIPLLLKTPAAVRFISAEPLLGPLGLRQVGPPPWPLFGPLEGYCSKHFPKKHCRCDRQMPSIDWVICGGESGPGARPMHPDWARGLRDQCLAAGVPFFFKQWGAYLPAMTDGAKDRSGALVLNASDQPVRVGKHAAGALLDGREWKQFPEGGR